MKGEKESGRRDGEVEEVGEGEVEGAGGEGRDGEGAERGRVWRGKKDNHMQ